MLERLRESVVSGLLSLATVERCWPVWSARLRTLIGQPGSPDTMLGVGDHLAEVFQSTGEAGRSQADLSGGGAAWEALVAWYLNLITLGTRTIVIKKGIQLPMPIRHSLAVRHGNKKTNSEADLVSVTLPTPGQSGSGQTAAALATFKDLSDYCEEHFGKLQVAVVQCKTNWNDNAQVPMLWDMVYKARKFADRDISVGENSYYLKDTASFRYAFVTVPTTKPERLNSNSLAVLRVAGLSGGNYWGHPSLSGVARSIKEIFPGAAIGPDGGLGIRASLKLALSGSGIPAYFGLQPATVAPAVTAD